jgi:hypothetical protein
MESNLHVCEVKAEKREFSQVTFLSFFGTGSPQMRSGKRASNEVYADMDNWKGLFSQKILLHHGCRHFVDFQQFLETSGRFDASLSEASIQPRTGL